MVEDLHEGVAFLAARTGATVVPVGIGGSASVMPKGKRVPRPRHIHLVVGHPSAPPERSGAGRIPRSRLHRLTEELTASIQELYDRAVTGHRAVLSPAADGRGHGRGDLPKVTRYQVVAMTRAYWRPKKRLPPFFEVPEARGCHTVGRSVMRQPRLAAVMTTSAVWYWFWIRRGRDVLQQLDAEGPVAVGGVGQLLGQHGVEDRRRRG